MRGDRIFARGRAGTRTNTPSLGSSGGGSGSLPVQVSSYSSGNVSADVWVGLHHSSNCHTRTATPPRTNPNTTTTTTTTNWPREEPRVSRKQALRQQYPRRLELRVLVQNTSGGPRPRPCSRHPFHGTVISTGSAKISGSRCHSGMLKVVENNGSSSGSGGGVVMENGGDPFAVDWSHASVLFKTADGRLLALPVLKARLLGVNGKGVAKPSENDSYLHSHHCSKSNADYEVKDDDYFYDAPCDDENKVLGALDVALYSATVALPAEVMVEPEFLTRALELRLPLSLHTLVNQQQTTPLRHEQQRMKGAGGGDMGGSNAPKSSSSSRKLFGLAVAKFVDEVEVWEHYDEVRMVTPAWKFFPLSFHLSSLFTIEAFLFFLTSFFGLLLR